MVPVEETNTLYTMTTATPLRAQIIGMEVGQVLFVPQGRYKANTIYNYTSFLGRELGRVYTTRYLKEEKAVEVKRTA